MASGKKNPFLNGFLAGLLAGLALAVAVALMVTRNNPFTGGSAASSENAAAPAAPAEAPKYEFYQAPPSEGAGAQQAETVPGAAYFLQAGAFASAADADEMKARLALLGLEARIQASQEGASQLYKLRMGPYKSLDELNRVRTRLTQNGMETMLVRIGPTQEEKP